MKFDGMARGTITVVQAEAAGTDEEVTLANVEALTLDPISLDSPPNEERGRST
jgi:hypothetical protein